MLVDELNLFLKEAAFLPSSFWAYKYFLSQKSFVVQAQAIAEEADKRSKSATELELFLRALKKPELKELELADSLVGLNNIFARSAVENDKLRMFEDLSGKFLNLAQLFDRFKKQRLLAKEAKTQEQQESQDLELIRGVGVGYVLEYYLSIYKLLQDKQADAQKLEFINTKEINLGFGGLPGLKQDFEQDESLTKFLLQILDDNLREELLRSYFWLKIQFEENPDDAKKIESALRQWIIVLLFEFKKAGMVALTSLFFKPYGEKPKITELISIFETNG